MNIYAVVFIPWPIEKQMRIFRVPEKAWELLQASLGSKFNKKIPHPAKPKAYTIYVEADGMGAALSRAFTMDKILEN